MRATLQAVALWVAFSSILGGCGPATVPATSPSAESPDSPSEKQSARAEPSTSGSPVAAPKKYRPGALAPPTAEEGARMAELGPVEACRGSVPFAPPVDEVPAKPKEAAVGGPRKGRLAPAVIQKEVRANFAALRGCYEPRLSFDPKLEGLVKTRFVIGVDGKVDAVHILDSTIPDCFVPQCVASEFQDLRFPEPEGGIVTVTYPIMFSPG